MKPPWERKQPLPRIAAGQLHVVVVVMEKHRAGYRRSKSYRVRTKTYREVLAFMDQLFVQWTKSAKLRVIR